MRKGNVLVVILCCFLISATAQRKSINVSVNYIKPYCGGARPTKEMQEEAQKPKPYAAQKLILLSESGKIDTVKTDSKGRIKLRLKYGNYKLQEPWRYYKTTYSSSGKSALDEKCLQDEWTRIAYIIKVSSGRIEILEETPIIVFCDWQQPCLNTNNPPPQMRE